MGTSDIGEVMSEVGHLSEVMADCPTVDVRLLLKCLGRLVCWILEPRPELELVLEPHRYPFMGATVGPVEGFPVWVPEGKPIVLGSIRV